MSAICYHGTSHVGLKKIRKFGFRPGTHFARHLEDALEFGGPVVLQVVFDDSLHHGDYWQFTNYNIVKPERIVSITEYRTRKVFDNPELREQVFRTAESQNQQETADNTPGPPHEGTRFSACKPQ